MLWGVISVLWVIVGFSLAFGDSIARGIIGNPMTYFAFKGVGSNPNPDFASTIPFLLFALFQLKFAIITPALITGSFAGRVRFRRLYFFHGPIQYFHLQPSGSYDLAPPMVCLEIGGVLDFAGPEQ